MNNDFLPEPSKRVSDFVAMIIVVVVVLLACAFIYVACEVADVTVELFDQGARELKEYGEKRSRDLEEWEKELDRLDRY